MTEVYFAQYDFIGKLIPTDWFSALLIVIFYIIFSKFFPLGSPWTRVLISIFAAIAIKGILVYIGLL
jgi:hypothetical protein